MPFRDIKHYRIIAARWKDLNFWPISAMERLGIKFLAVAVRNGKTAVAWLRPY